MPEMSSRALLPVGWGLSEHLWPNSQRGKWISVAAFIPCFGLALICHFTNV